MDLKFRIITAIEGGEVANPEILRLYEKWHELKAVDPLPRLADMASEELGCRHDLMLVERLDAGGYRYLTYGANIAMASGFDLTGKTSEALTGDASDFFVSCYDRALQETTALYTTNPALHAALVSSWERLLLPLCDERAVPRYLLVYNRPRSFRHELLSAILDAASDAIIGLGTMLDEHHEAHYVVVALNSRAEQILGPRRGVIGRRLDDLLRAGDPALPGEAYVTAALKSSSPAIEWHRTRGPTDEWYRVEVRPFANGAVVTLADITALKQTQTQLSHMAITDALTGAHNRRHFEGALDKEIEVTQRDRRRVTSLILLDLDHFKTVNDTHGHSAGDDVLIELVDRLTDQLRTHDVLARVGGEEFALLLPGTDRPAAAIIAERLRVVIECQPFDAHGNTLDITCSFGVASRVDGDDRETLMSRADGALYAAKAAGRNRVELAQDEAPAVKGA